MAHVFSIICRILATLPLESKSCLFLPKLLYLLNCSSEEFKLYVFDRPDGETSVFTKSKKKPEYHGKYD